jgi:hypothetical protein
METWWKHTLPIFQTFSDSFTLASFWEKKSNNEAPQFENDDDDDFVG